MDLENRRLNQELEESKKLNDKQTKEIKLLIMKNIDLQEKNKSAGDTLRE
jgi:hypothetical protein